MLGLHEVYDTCVKGAKSCKKTPARSIYFPEYPQCLSIVTYETYKNNPKYPTQYCIKRNMSFACLLTPWKHQSDWIITDKTNKKDLFYCHYQPLCHDSCTTVNYLRQPGQKQCSEFVQSCIYMYLMLTRHPVDTRLNLPSPWYGLAEDRRRGWENKGDAYKKR